MMMVERNRVRVLVWVICLMFVPAVLAEVQQEPPAAYTFSLSPGGLIAGIEILTPDVLKGRTRIDAKPPSSWRMVLRGSWLEPYLFQTKWADVSYFGGSRASIHKLFVGAYEQYPFYYSGESCKNVFGGFVDLNYEPWYPGAEHIVETKATVGGVLFISEHDFPLHLQFTLKGLAYVSGRGTARYRSGKVADLGSQITAARWRQLASSGTGVAREAGITALGYLKDKKSIPLLASALSDTSTLVRIKAVESLGRIGGKEVVEPLVKAAEDKEAWVRCAAAEALGKAEVNNPNAVGALLSLVGKAADVNSPREAEVGIWALQKIAGFQKSLSEGTDVNFLLADKKTLAALHIEETVLCKLPPGLLPRTIIVSPDGKHVAFVVAKGRKRVVVLDGNEDRKYDKVGGLRFSPDSRHLVYLGWRGQKQMVVVDGKAGRPYDLILEGRCVYSQDGNHVAYAASRAGKQMVVVNGREGREYEQIGRGTLALGSKGQVAYAARRNRDWIVVIGSNEGRAYEDLPAPGPVFSPNGRRFAYVAVKGKKRVFVVDGVEGPEYDRIGPRGPVFSPDSKRVGYLAVRGGKQLVVLDGVEGKEYDGVGVDSPVFSPDGKRMGYSAKRRSKGYDMVVVVDGVESQPYLLLWFDVPVFSPDSKRVAYIAQRTHKLFAVVDGQERREYNAIHKSSLAFSPDSKHVAYVAYQGKKSFVVLDGVEGEKYDEVAGLVFDPHGTRYAYVAWSAGKSFVVTDRVQGSAYDGIGSTGVVFGPNGKHFAYEAVRGKKRPKRLIVVDGIESREYDSILRGAKPVFDGPHSLHVIALRGLECLLVQIEIVGK